MQESPAAQPPSPPSTEEAQVSTTDVVDDAVEALVQLELPAWVPGPFADTWTYLQDHRWLQALVILAAFAVAAKLTQWISTGVVSRLTAKTETRLDDEILEVVRKPIFLTVFLFGLAAAFRSLELPASVTRFTVDLLKTLVVLSWTAGAFRVSRLVLDALARNRKRFAFIEERTIPLFDILSKILVVAGGSYAVLLVWDIDPTAWLASAGVIGLAVGFAAKDTLANLFAGFFIVADTPYKIGDFVVIESGERGMVTHVGIRSTRILTRDDVEITIPNAVIANNKIINESGGPWPKHRLRIAVGAAYGADVDEVCRVLEETAASHPEVCKDPSPRVRMRGFGDSSLNFELLAWVEQPVARGKVSHDLYMSVYNAFAEAGLEIPFPQRDLHVKELPPQDRGPETPPAQSP